VSLTDPLACDSRDGQIARVIRDAGARWWGERLQPGSDEFDSRQRLFGSNDTAGLPAASRIPVSSAIGRPRRKVPPPARERAGGSTIGEFLLQ
jgi:hypothetical protein